MEDAKVKKRELRILTQKNLEELPAEEFQSRSKALMERLMDFANYQESQTVLLYHSLPHEADTSRLVSESFKLNKTVLLPITHPRSLEILTFKMDPGDNSLRKGVTGRKEPDPRRAKHVPLQYIELALIPGIAFDERGGRVGYGTGSYDRLIPQLPVTTRKVALALEQQLVPQVPMEAHDRFVDIIITEERVIYKI